MTVTVSAPNGATVQFPDGTDHDTIDRVMTQHFHPDASARAEATAFAARMPTLETTGPDATPKRTFTVQAPTGKSYTIEGDNAEGAVAALKKYLGSDMPPQGSSLGGVAKSLGTGLAQGVVGLAGIPGDLDNLLAKGNHYRIDGSGFHYGPASTGETSLPTSDSLQKNVEGVTGEFYKPQGAAEDIANKIGQFAPAMIGGPETLATKLATRVAAPALASEAAGKLTEGTAAQPYAELGGALLGASGTTAGMRKFQELVAARNAAKLIPAADDIKAASRALYRHPDVAAVQIHPAAVSDLADTISADLQHGTNSGFRPANEPKVFSAIDELNTAAKEKRPASIADIDNVRQVLGGLAKEKDAIGQPTRQAAAASRAIDQVNDFLPNLKQPDLLAGDAAKANSILDEARGNWAAYKPCRQRGDKRGVVSFRCQHSERHKASVQAAAEKRRGKGCILDQRRERRA
jgi:hypothetical protein